MSSSPSHSHTHVGSSKSQVNVLDYCSRKHTLLEPQKQLKTPKSKNITLHVHSPIDSDRVRHVRFIVRPPSTSPQKAKTYTPLQKALASTHANTYRYDYGYHYAGAGSPKKPPTRQAPHSFEINPQPPCQPTTVTRSTSGPAEPSTPSPVARSSPDAPLRRQGCTKPRFEALSCAVFTPRSNSPSPLSLRALTRDIPPCSPTRHPATHSSKTPRQPFTPVRPVAHLRELAPQAWSHSPSPLSSQRASLPRRPATAASAHLPVSQFRRTHSPQASESYSRAGTATPPLVQQHMPVTLCPQGDEARFQDWVVSLTARMGTIDHWIDSCHSPDSCESAVTSPSASSVADSWSARSTSIATETSRAPFPYRVPPFAGNVDLLSALVGKRIWRVSPNDKAAFLEYLDMVDPQHLLSTPPTRCTSIHNWIADIPTPHTPSPARPSRLRDLTPSPLSSSFFSPALGSPGNLDTQAHGLPAMSSSPELAPACQASPSSEASSDGWLFNRRRFFVRRASPAASPSPRASSPVILSSPTPAASPSIRASPPVAQSSPAPAASPLLAVSPSSSPDNNKLSDALSKLQSLLAAGSPVPITRSSSPVIHSSPAAPASPAASPTAHHHSPVVTRSTAPPRPLSRKRKLAADASPAPTRSRPGVTRFGPPTAFRFMPALPDSLPSLPRPGTSMPGSFPTAIRVEPLAPAAPSTTAPGFPWKTVAGIAAGAFALGCLASRYLF